MWLSLEHEMFRMQNWESLKHFRSKYDNEYHLSESILDMNEIQSRKRELDKICINAIRKCIADGLTEKIFSYMDMLNFQQSLKICIKLCEQMKQP